MPGTEFTHFANFVSEELVQGLNNGSNFSLQTFQIIRQEISPRLAISESYLIAFLILSRLVLEIVELLYLR